MNKKIALLLSVLVTGVFSAQEKLSLETAIQQAIEKNYDVLMSKSDKDIAAAQNNWGNAGMAPQVSVAGALTGATLDSYQEFGNGTVQDRNGAKSLNANAGLLLNWTIFDGMKMFAVKTRLNSGEKISELQYKQQLEQLTQNVISVYYNVVRIQLLIAATEQNLEIVRERMKLVSLRNQIGSGSKVELLMSQTDENKGNAELLKLKQQLLAAKTELNVLMNRSPETDFITDTDIPQTKEADVEAWRNDLLTKNTSLLLAKENEYAGEQLLKEARSLYLPQVNLNTSFNFLRNQTEAGFVLLNRQTGFNGGLTAGWTIFNGRKTSGLVQERKLSLLKMRYFTEKSKQSIQSTLYIQYRQYRLAEALVKLETENLKSAEELLSLSEERFKTGKATLIETKETQKILEEAKVRLINARYDLKIAETEMMKAAGVLVK